MTALDQIVIDSKDRESSSASATDFSILMPDATEKIVSIEITKIILPYVFDTVDHTNSTFTLDGTPYTISSGQYNILDLIAALNLKTPGYTWTFELHGRIKVAAASTFTFVPGISAILLGFTETTHSGATSYTGTYYPSLTEDSDYLTLHSKELYKNEKESQFHSDYRSNMIALIPILVPFGSIQIWEPQRPIIFNVENFRLTSLDFKLLDKGGNQININNGSFVINMVRYKSNKVF